MNLLCTAYICLLRIWLVCRVMLRHSIPGILASTTPYRKRYIQPYLEHLLKHPDVNTPTL